MKNVIEFKNGCKKMKNTMTHYYVQGKEENKSPFTVCHKYDKEKDEYYHKFMSRKSAMELLKAEKEINPSTKYRLIKNVETITINEWI